VHIFKQKNVDLFLKNVYFCYSIDAKIHILMFLLNLLRSFYSISLFVSEIYISCVGYFMHFDYPIQCDRTDAGKSYFPASQTTRYYITMTS